MSTLIQVVRSRTDVRLQFAEGFIDLVLAVARPTVELTVTAGAPGPPGPRGVKGDKGDPGDPGPTGSAAEDPGDLTLYFDNGLT